MINSSVLLWFKKLAADMRRIADNDIRWQTVTGQWTRNSETARPIAGQGSRRMMSQRMAER